MLPKTLALVDDNKEYVELLSQHLEDHGIKVDVFHDSNDLLIHPEPYHYDFYIIDLMLPGVDGVNTIELIRKRSRAGLLVISGRALGDAFKLAIDAGADMYLTKPVPFDQVLLAIRAVQRRAQVTVANVQDWMLDRKRQQLVAPDGARVALSEIDVALLECFVEAGGDVVSRETLRQRLGRDAMQGSSDGLNATVYRLRRRIERATPVLVPLQSRSRVGYVFKAPLKVT